MIIELCGVPGAGKSSIASELVTELRGHGLTASLSLEDVSPRTPRPRRLTRKVMWASIETVRHPRESARVIRAVVRSGQRARSDVAIRSLNWLVLRAALRRARATVGFNVIDQGLVQELCSLGYGGDAGSVIDIADPGANLLAPDLILVIDVEPAIADQRLADRPGRESRIEANGIDRRRELERQGALIEELLAAWLDRYGDLVPTTTRRIVNGHGPIDIHDLVAYLRLQNGAEAKEPERAIT